MQVSVETTEGLERRLSVEVPADRIDSEVQQRLKKMAGSVRLDGFRPGKVPMKVVQNRFGEQIRHEVIGEVLQSSFYEAISQEKLRPAGRPEIEPTSMEPGKSLAYTAVFEVYPELTLAGMDQIRIERPVTGIEAADVDRMIETLRKQRTTWEAVERPAQDGDQLVMDFEGTIDGEGFQGNKAEGAELVLGSGRFIPGFEEGMLGATAGEERTLDLQFPEDYPAQEVAGKPVRFKVRLTAVEEPKLPEVDAEFAKSFGVADGDLESLREQVRENMQRELDQTIKNTVKNQVMDGLIEANPIEIPKALIAEEISRLQEQARMQFGGGADMKLPDEMFTDQAERRIKLGLILAEIIQANQMKVDPERLRSTIENIAAAYEDPEQVVKWYYSRKDQMSELESVVLEDQVVDWILGQAQVTEKETPFNELMKVGEGA
jgi:trigger factor